MVCSPVEQHGCGWHLADPTTGDPAIPAAPSDGGRTDYLGTPRGDFKRSAARSRPRSKGPAAEDERRVNRRFGRRSARLVYNALEVMRLSRHLRFGPGVSSLPFGSVEAEGR